MRFLNNERTKTYVICEKIASDTVIRKIATFLFRAAD